MTTRSLCESLVASVLILLISTGCSSKTETNTDADVAAINGIWETYSSSLNDGDIDSWLSLWTEDGVQMPPNEAPVIGKDQLRQRNGGALDLFVVDIEITNEEVEVAGSLAFSRGHYVATFSPKDGAQPIPVDGKFMTILKKQPDGSWKIHRDIFNSNVAPGGQ
jgi:uncharacterized protein (TIGR02246 family)